MATPLPARNILDGTIVPNTSTAKGALGSLRDFLAGLIGTTGAVVDARAAMGVNNGLTNKLINSNFSINQRAVSGTVTLAAGVYGHDRWRAGAGGCTYTFATALNITTLTITAGTLQQVIEGVNLQSGAHKLSWTGTAQGRVDSGSYGATGVTGTAVGGTNQTVEFGTGTLSLVQYEFGLVVTLFEQRLIGMELSLCFRYTRAFRTIGYFASQGYGLYGDTSTIYYTVNGFDMTTMRAIPSIFPIGVQGTDWCVETSGGAIQTGFALSITSNIIVGSKTAHGLTQSGLIVLTSSGAFLLAAEI